MKPVKYLSIDIECSGPNPLMNDVISIGITSNDEDMELFYKEENLRWHEDTMSWFQNINEEAHSYNQIGCLLSGISKEQMSSALIEYIDRDKDVEHVIVAQPTQFDLPYLRSWFGEELYPFKKIRSLDLFSLFYPLLEIKVGQGSESLHKAKDLYKIKKRAAVHSMNENTLKHTALYDAKVQHALLNIILNDYGSIHKILCSVGAAYEVIKDVNRKT